jgi:dihydroflavonol-4-reductase
VVYGPGDRSPHALFMMDLIRGRVPGLPMRPAWWSYVHVDDVAEGIVAAAERGRPGETYVLSGEHMRMDEFARRVARLAGRRPPPFRFPGPVLRISATLMDVIARVTGLRTSINRENVEMVNGWRWLHSHAKATRELGWVPRPLAEGLPETVAWLRAQLGR